MDSQLHGLQCCRGASAPLVIASRHAAPLAQAVAVATPAVSSSTTDALCFVRCDLIAADQATGEGRILAATRSGAARNLRRMSLRVHCPPRADHQRPDCAACLPAPQGVRRLTCGSGCGSGSWWGAEMWQDIMRQVPGV